MHPISTPLVIVLLLFLVGLLPPFPIPVPHNISFSKKKCKHQSNCGVVLNIKPPFRLEGDSQGCGLPGYQLSCEHNHTVLHLDFNKYYVKAIDYGKRRIRVTDPRVHMDNCSTLQGYSLTEINFEPFRYYEPFTLVVFLTCKDLVQSAHYVDAAPCTTAKDFSDSFVHSSDEHSYSYALIGNNLVASDIEDSCCIHNVVAYDYDLHWSLRYGSSFVYFLPEIGGRFLTFILARAHVGIIVLFAFLIYKCRRRHLSVYDNVEEFLQSQNNLMPIRYSYKEIKKMTNNFKDKLGKGGYGDVYEGKSRSGHLVAIKMLNEAKGSGQDFINEVATIGRIYHINVVRLVGFCATASKRALVYDYMPNGSLDKFIFSDDPNCIPLSWERTCEIAVGVARGIAYLHQGCNMQILHFDIKPHNVLLDENFVPKLSDFGLAKLYPTEKSAVTLTAARGTLGYMAPELIYKKIGGVSYKADVYSFGQLLLAMVGRRKLNAITGHSSRVYFSSWIYDKVDGGEDENLDLGDITENEKKIVRKIILVALWCVQWTPAERPSMREVLEMLEGDLEDLKFPPKPLYCPPDLTIREQSSNRDTGVSTFPLCESIALEIEKSD